MPRLELLCKQNQPVQVTTSIRMVSSFGDYSIIKLFDRHIANACIEGMINFKVSILILLVFF